MGSQSAQIQTSFFEFDLNMTPVWKLVLDGYVLRPYPFQ
jgi:hypothetical protein